MKRIIFLLSFVLVGCRLEGNWQPYAILYTQPEMTATQTEQPKPTATPQDVCIVSADALNLRAGAGTSYPVIDWLSVGDVLTQTGNKAGAWIEVTTPQDVTGWVNSNFCNEVKP